MAEGDERSNKFEDLFDDLDRFFAPGDEEATESSAPGGQPASAGSDAPAAPTPDLTPPPVETPGATAGGEPAETRWPDDVVDVSDSAADAEAGQPTQSQSPAPADAPTAETAGRDWGRLRDVLGDEDDEQGDEFDFLGGDDSSALFGYDTEEDPLAASEPLSEAETGEAPHELTVEDLKKPPPEYTELPPPPEEQPSVVVADPLEGPIVGGSGGSEDVEDASFPDELRDEREIADVDATAAQVADEFGHTPAGVDDDLLSDIFDAGPDLDGGVSEEMAEESPPEEPPEPPPATVPASRPAARTVKVTEPEAMMGPTWEEPTSRPLTRDPSAPHRGGRNLPAAVLTAVALAALALISLAINKAIFAVIGGVVVLLAQAELYATMQRRGHQPATALGLVMGGLIIAGAYLRGEPAMLFFVVFSLLFAFLWYMAAPPKLRQGLLAHIGTTLLGVLYVPLLASFVLLILGQTSQGRGLTLSVLGLTFAYDASAYFIGSFWGSTPLAPTISPKKSWQGLWGATLATGLIAAAILPAAVGVLSIGKAMALWLIVVVFAPIGDLVESVIKRDLGVKDMGSVLPGHGGALDRIDSLLLVAPAAFYLFRLIF